MERYGTLIAFLTLQGRAAMPPLPYHRELSAFEDELVRAEIALWRRQLALTTGRHHAMGKAERMAVELRLAELGAYRPLGRLRK